MLRERKIFGLHPRELTECAMDIVTPGKYWPIGQYLYSPLIGPEAGGHGLVMADAELMVMCEDLVRAVTSDKRDKLFFRVSHHDLVKGILSHFGITGDR